VASKTFTQDEHPPRNTPESMRVSAVVAGVVLAVGSWAGLIWLVQNSLPTVPNRWAFYALLFLALTGSALPFTKFLNQTFNRRPVTEVVLLRQAMWVGLYGTTCVWLLIPRLFSLPVAIILAIALLIIEGLLRLREGMQWQPPQ